MELGTTEDDTGPAPVLPDSARGAAPRAPPRPACDARLRRLAPWILLAVTAAALLPGSSTIPLLDRDEPRFARAAVEMIEAGEWFVPTFNGSFRFDKPILTYWLMRGGYALFGVSELGARIHSVVFAAILLLVVLWIGSRWFSPRAGLHAAFGLGTCVQVLFHGRAAVADMPMILCVTLAHLAAWELLRHDGPRTPWRWFLLLYGALGVGFLAKGPVTFLVPLLTLLLHRLLFWRRRLPWSRLRLGLGLPLTLIVIALWGIPALVATDGLYWQVGFNKHVLRRGVEGLSGTGPPIFFYFITAFFSLFPWISFAGAIPGHLRRHWNERNAFLLSWIAGTYGFFAFYATHYMHYVLPCFPAFFLLLGQLDRGDTTRGRGERIFFRSVAGLYLAAFGGLALLGAAGGFPAPYAPLRMIVLAAAGVIAALLSFALIARFRRTRLLPLAFLLLAVSTILLGAGLRRVTPALLMQDLLQEMPPEAEYLCHDYREPSLVHYADHSLRILRTPEELEEAVESPGPRLIILTEEEITLDAYARWRLHRLLGRPAELKIQDHRSKYAALDTSGYRTRTVEAVNIAKPRWIRLRVLFRFEG